MANAQRKRKPRAPARTKAQAEEPALPGWFSKLIDEARARARKRVAALRAQHPGEDARTLGERLVRSSANRAGWFGAATGAVSLFALPVGLPAGVGITLFLEAELIFGLLEIHAGEDPAGVHRFDTGGEKGRLRLAALWAGAGFADAAKSAGLKLGADALGRALAGSLPARIIARLNPVLLRAILKRLGLGFVPRVLKLWPLLGAPIAYALDRSALRTLGKGALATLESVALEERAQAASARARPKRKPARARSEAAKLARADAAQPEAAETGQPALRTRRQAATAKTTRRATRRSSSAAGTGQD